MQYHEKYEYDELLLPGESFDFEITWYWGDTEGDLIAEIDELPQEVTGDCEVINAGYASR